MAVDCAIGIIFRHCIRDMAFTIFSRMKQIWRRELIL